MPKEIKPKITAPAKASTEVFIALWMDGPKAHCSQPYSQREEAERFVKSVTADQENASILVVDLA